MCETFSPMTRPQQMHLNNLININRRIAAGLRGRHSGAQAISLAHDP
jgi:hypothetical protein